VTRAGTFAALLVALMLAIPGSVYARALTVRRSACQLQQAETGIATRWTPWGGCHATVLGTDLKVGP
jgi:L-arabinose isomerase